MKKILLIAHHQAYSRQIDRWAKLIKKNGLCDPIIYTHSYKNIQYFSSSLKERITIISPSFKELCVNGNAEKEKIPIKFKILNRIKGFLSKIVALPVIKKIYFHFGFSIKFFLVTLHYIEELNRVRELIRNYDVNAVIISDSCPAYEGLLYIRAAHKENVPIVTIPIANISKISYADIYYHSQTLNLNRPINSIIGYFLPKWVFPYKNQRLLRVEPEYILALECLNLESDNPWNYVGNQEDLVLLDSQASFNHYLKEGLYEDQMVVIGSAEHDMMYQLSDNQIKEREALYEKLGLPSGKPMILSPLVQYHYVSGRPECDFQDYEKMVEYWVKTLGDISQYNVIINLHPSHIQEKHHWNYIEEWGVKISNEDITSLIPLCDIFVAAGSSTIPWAIACGKPVVNYNIYKYDSNVYESACGVFTVKEKDEFIDILLLLTNDSNFLTEACISQNECAHYWGNVDGKAVERLINVIELLVNRDE